MTDLKMATECRAGEKIGKEHLTYGQGAAAGLVAIGTIAAEDSFGLPVSTTHVLSSGGYDDAFPADHGAKPERERDRKLHPVRDEFGRVVETLL
jgi:hypothetical protein